jgi:hypothetical protein
MNPPDKPKESAFCVASSVHQAGQIVSRLQAAGFSNDDITAVLPDDEATRHFAEKNHTQDPGAASKEGKPTPAGLSEIGNLVLPGAGPFIAVEPIEAALEATPKEPTEGGVAGEVRGLGIPEMGARNYEEKIHQGNILIAVRTDKADEIKLAVTIFDQVGGRDIWTTFRPGK